MALPSSAELLIAHMSPLTNTNINRAAFTAVRTRRLAHSRNKPHAVEIILLDLRTGNC